jgi:NMD protein affecting ribosome stability and mRNA decay
MPGPAHFDPAARNQPVVKRRRDAIVPEAGHDAYRMPAKLPEATRCPGCGAVYHGGRWTWDAAGPNPHMHTCPACRRIEDRYPAAFLSLSGPFLAGRHDEILRLVENEARAEAADHPLHRLVAIEHTDEGILITTTDVHLPRRIGEALRHAYHGELEYRYAEDDNVIRAAWNR